MQEYLSSLSGIHPRLEDTIQATQDWERGRIDQKLLDECFRFDVAALVELQKRLKFDYLCDGQLTTAWQDMFTPITTGVDGVRKGPMVRWFNTNTFYYVPVIEGPIRARDELLDDGRPLLDSSVISGGRGKVVLPDPLTFADCSDNTFYPNREKLMFEYCDQVLRPVLESLSKAGVKYVQFSAPALVARFRQERAKHDEISVVGEGLRSSVKGLNLTSGYHTFFGDASPYLPDLVDLIRTDDLGIDFTETDPQSLGRGFGGRRGLIAGIANARSSYVESPRELARIVSRLAECRFRRIILAPSADLRHVPRTIADKKTESIAKAKELVVK